MATRIAINGFGRIGSTDFRALYSQKLFGKEFEVVAVGDIVPGGQPRLPAQVRLDPGQVRRSSRLEEVRSLTRTPTSFWSMARRIKVVSAKSPAELPWEGLGG